MSASPCHILPALKPCVLAAGLFLALNGGCDRVTHPDPSDDLRFDFDFDASAQGWTGDFADYPNQPDAETFFEFQFSHSALPSPLDGRNGALMLSGANRSDDLFMFIKRKVSGLEPNQNYRVDIEIEFASNAANGMVGIGGAPGESVFIKAGASSLEPNKVLSSPENWYRMNIDKGNQSQEGANMRLIGHFGNGTGINAYTLKTLRTPDPIQVRTNPQGELWLVIGTDSGFEGTTRIYYNDIDVSIRKD